MNIKCSTRLVITVILMLVFSFYGCVSLHSVVQKNNYDKSFKIIEGGADVNEVDETGLAPLHFATKQRNKEIFQLLINSGADINIQDNDGLTPLHYSIRMKDSEFSKLIITYKPNIDIRDKKGETPLHYASISRDIDLCKLIIDSGGNCNLKNNNGDAPIHYAIKSNDTKMINTFINNKCDLGIMNGDGIPLIHLSVENDSINSLNALIDRKIDVDIQDGRGQTALYYAISRNKYEHIEALLKAGANPNKKTPAGEMLIFIPLKNNNTNTFELLHEHNANVRVLDNDRKSILHYGVINKDLKVIKIAFAERINPDIIDDNNFSAFHYAVINNDHEIISLLLSGGANINFYSNKDNYLTPLEILVFDKSYIENEKEFLSNVEFLLKNGANFKEIKYPKFSKKINFAQYIMALNNLSIAYSLSDNFKETETILNFAIKSMEEMKDTNIDFYDDLNFILFYNRALSCFNQKKISDAKRDLILLKKINSDRLKNLSPEKFIFARKELFEKGFTKKEIAETERKKRLANLSGKWKVITDVPFGQRGDFTTFNQNDSKIEGWGCTGSYDQSTGIVTLSSFRAMGSAVDVSHDVKAKISPDGNQILGTCNYKTFCSNGLYKTLNANVFEPIKFVRVDE